MKRNMRIIALHQISMHALHVMNNVAITNFDKKLCLLKNNALKIKLEQKTQGC